MNRAPASLTSSNTHSQSLSHSHPRLVVSESTESHAGGEVRPRNRRLISTEQELVSTSNKDRSSEAARANSPIPARHPSRLGDVETSSSSSRGRVGGREAALGVPGQANQKSRGSSPGPFGGLWEGGWQGSWSALQGLANSVLGGEGEGEDVSTSGGFAGLGGKRGKKSETWGPAGLPQKKKDVIAAGSLEERETALRIRRTRGVLEGREEDLNARKDTNGNFKRRTSVDEAGPSPAEAEDALVYVHRVQPQDTLAGVILRYNCQPAVFRKANRFWPNDSIQTRKVVVIPVDASTIRGRPCDPPSLDSKGVDLLAPTPQTEDSPSYAAGSSSWPPADQGTSAERPEMEEEHPWTHVRWVLIDASPSSKPVEIARMPRKTLGYFPPRRRKSQNTFSSPSSTPRGSFDLVRPPYMHHSPAGSISSSNATSRRTSNLGPRPPVGSYFPSASTTSNPSPSATRSRRESVGDVAERMGWMRGPGGVGTMGSNVRRPGPANDGLNAWAKKHIPGLAIDSLPSTAAFGGDAAHFGFGDELTSIAEGSLRLGNATGGSGTVTPSNGAGQGLGLENAAAAIEGWVRRLAIKGGSVAGGGMTPKFGARADADLIELLDGAGSDDGRGFELAPGVGTPVGGTGREDLDGVIRGRQAAGGKGGKSD